MFRLWAKELKNGRLMRDMIVENNSRTLNRTRKIFAAIDTVCHEFDLSKPIWFDATVEEFKKHDKVRFTSDHFIDSIDFDYLEIEVIEED